MDEILKRLELIEKHIEKAQKPYADYSQIENDLQWLNRWLLTDKPSRIEDLKTKIEMILRPF